ncbi:MAG TPA: hypothetical protein VKG38_01920 [Solirubrobacteraceae bacterium]|nr:hypothetical protein [Solirubrobacteraceae bacterium]
MSEDQDWRLVAELDVADARRTVDDLIGRLRGADGGQEAAAAVPDDVVITHDGKLLFAYASTEEMLASARTAIEDLLRSDGISVSMRVSRWDDERDAWLQIDPPPTEEQRQAQAAAERDAETMETRTMVASAGRWVRASFEQTMLDWAAKLGLECTIIEHPHLLTTQVGFTVTGPKGKIDEFSRGLKAEGAVMMRGESTVMLSPL